MKKESSNYYKIAKAIEYFEKNFRNKPSVDEVAKYVGVSKAHFQRIFSAWAGISPQKFSNYLMKEFAKDLLLESSDILTATYEIGLSSPGRLHDLFVNYEAVSPGEYKNMKNLEINYGFADSPFGICLIGFTERGVCELSFVDESKTQSLNVFKSKWPGAIFKENKSETTKLVGTIFNKSRTDKPLKLLLKGTNFQIKVWEALLKIPNGQITNYKEIATAVGSPKASRAVGTAIGHNNIAYIIPCHRVLNKNGKVGNYRWGSIRKKIMLTKELG